MQLSALLVGGYAFAVSIGINIAATDIVKVLLGEQWLQSVPILQMLCWAVGPNYISHVVGHAGLPEQTQIKTADPGIDVILIAALLLCAVPTNHVTNIAAAMVIMEWVRVGTMAVKLSRLLYIPAWQMLLVVLCISIVAASTGLCIYGVTHTPSEELNSVYRLISRNRRRSGGPATRALSCCAIQPDKLPAIGFLCGQSPRLAKLFPKSSY